MSFNPTASTFVGGDIEKRGGLTLAQPQIENKTKTTTEVSSLASSFPQSATVYEAKPLAPLFDIRDPLPDPGPEPEPWTATADGWDAWVRTDNARRAYLDLIAKRDKADAYAEKNDLAGISYI